MKVLAFLAWSAAMLNAGALSYAWDEITASQRRGGLVGSVLLIALAAFWWLAHREVA